MEILDEKFSDIGSLRRLCLILECCVGVVIVDGTIGDAKRGESNAS